MILNNDLIQSNNFTLVTRGIASKEDEERGTGKAGGKLSVW